MIIKRPELHLQHKELEKLGKGSQFEKDLKETDYTVPHLITIMEQLTQNGDHILMIPYQHECLPTLYCKNSLLCMLLKLL